MKDLYFLLALVFVFLQTLQVVSGGLLTFHWRTQAVVHYLQIASLTDEPDLQVPLSRRLINRKIIDLHQYDKEIIMHYKNNVTTKNTTKIAFSVDIIRI